MNDIKFSIYRFNPDFDKKPYNQDYTLKKEILKSDMKLLDALKIIQQEDPTLAYRKSCGEGVCGSDGMNVNGTNRLACITPLSELGNKISLKPLPGLPVIRDLIIDLTQFMDNYKAVKPYLIRKTKVAKTEILQTPAQRDKLDGLYECILCACCSTSCPSFWWNPDKFLGPAALLQSARFIMDSRDEAKDERLKDLDDAYKLFRCHTIMNCQICPKDLNPTKAISDIKKEMLKNNCNK
ncbi:MAG: succinate dehydrogenase iron-sulfur subunit [Gammaproteobacteria bacterium]|nr:MAG: succinate dehydrogenase iron-sulfur subunit [Gammaproteobacteria bacterium]